MNKELAHELKALVSSLPFIDVFAGMVQTVEYADPIDGQKEGARVGRKRMPVAYDTNIENCTTSIKENPLVPNSDKKGILYFEDGGVSNIKKTGKGYEMRSTLVLVCWMNRQKIVGNSYAEISGKCMVEIFDKLVQENPFNAGIFTRLKVRPNRILQQNKNVFALYTYDETVNQYLRPPFEFFGIELVCTYTVPTACFNAIQPLLIECDAPAGNCNDIGCPNGRQIAMLDNIKQVNYSIQGNNLTVTLNPQFINNIGLPSVNYRVILGVSLPSPITQAINIGATVIDISTLPVGTHKCKVISSHGAYFEFEIIKPQTGQFESTIEQKLTLKFAFTCEDAPNYLIEFTSSESKNMGSFYQSGKLMLQGFAIKTEDYTNGNPESGEDFLSISGEAVMPIHHQEENGLYIEAEYKSTTGNTCYKRAILKSKCI